MEEIKCVLKGCDKKAVGSCNNCRMPICNIHGKRVDQVYLCINCIDYMKKLGLRR